MKAIQAAERGGYEALRFVDIPDPQPQAGQSVVKVTAAGVTPLDRTAWPACTRLLRSRRSCPATRAPASSSTILQGVSPPANEYCSSPAPLVSARTARSPK